MKTLLISFCLLVGLSAFGQTAVRSSGGAATNLNLWGVTTNKGVAVRLGSGALGTMYSLVDTNGTGRFIIQGHNIYLADTNGNFQLRVTSLGVELPTGPITGDGSGLTNLAGATNFSESVVYNFNGKVTFNAVSYNTNLWAGPTNTLILSTNYQDYITTTDVNITNIGGQLARQNTWTTLTISNAAASSITARVTASGVRAQGSGTTAALVIPSGKEAIYSFLSRDFKSTNYCNTVQQ